jgi:hypothetical protein
MKLKTQAKACVTTEEMKMVRIGKIALLTVALLIIGSCSKTPEPVASNQSNQSQTANTTSQPAATTSQTTQPNQPIAAGDLKVGEARGSYTSKGEKVELKYAYATRGKRFNEDSLIILVTENPIPPDALAEEFKDQTLLLGEKLRGLEYVIGENGMWVRYHPGQYQESTSNKLKDYSVQGDIVKGTDDESDLSNGKYPRAVRFVAQIVK